MSGYLRRLATTGAAYTAASILSKVIAVALLPLYTRYLTRDDYGAAEILFAAVVAASIVIRFGLIEAILRFYYKQDEDPARVVAGTFAGLFWLATLGALVALPFAVPLSELLLPEPEKLGDSAPDLVRIAIGGLWVLTMWEYMLTLFRLEERARAFFVTTILNVIAAIALTVVLVVGLDEGARGLLLGSYATGAAFVVAPDRPAVAPPLAADRPRPPAAPLPLRPADDAGRGIALRAQLRRPPDHRPLARPHRGGPLLDRRSSSRRPSTSSSAASSSPGRRSPTRSATTTRPAASTPPSSPSSSPPAPSSSPGCGCSRAGSSAPWRRRSSSTPTKSIGLISTAVTLYALYLVLVVILGRTGRTEFNLPAAVGALVVNVALNLALVPPLGIDGAALALVASYLVVLGLMYVFTQRLFPVPYEWGRLLRVVLTVAALVGARRTRGADRGRPRTVAPNRALHRLPAAALGDRVLQRRRARVARAPAPPPARFLPTSPHCARNPPRSTVESPRPTRSSAWTRTPALPERGRGGTRRDRGGAPGGHGPT